MNDTNPYAPPQTPVADLLVTTAVPTNVLPYVMVCFVCVGLAYLGTIEASKVLASWSQFLLWLLGLLASICVAAYLFGRRNHRQLLYGERSRFTFGCFVAFWCFDELWSFASSVVGGIPVTAERVVYLAEDSALDFLVVWLVVRFVAPHVMPKLRADGGALSSNTSLERTREG